MSIRERYQAYRASLQAAEDFRVSTGLWNDSVGTPQRTTWSVRPECGHTAEDVEDD